ncbi:MAG: SpoIIE family protein phosphatase [Actinomycetota bacterium]
MDALFQSGVFSVDPKIASRLSEIGINHEMLVRADLGFRLLAFLIFAVTGLVIFARKSDDWMTGLSSGLLLSAGMAWFAPLNTLSADSPLTTIAGFIGNQDPFSPETGRTVLGVTLLLFLFLFPDGRFVPRWSRFVALAAAVHVVLWLALPGSLIDPGSWPSALRMAVVVAAIGLGNAAQIYRYNVVASPTHRQQTKLVVSALATIVAVVVFLFALNPGLGSGFENLTLVTPRVEAIYNLILLVVLAVALLLLPVSIGISILRYRLWDVDVLINKTLVYAALTGVLGLGYGLIVATIGAFVTRSYFTVAVATLLVSLAFQPLRRRIQDLIDRHFYRARYDATKTMDEFTDRLRQEIDLETLSSELLGVVSQTLIPTGVSLWVPQSNDGMLVSDSATMHRISFYVKGGVERVRGSDFDEITLDAEALAILRSAAGPIDVDNDPESESLARFRDVYVKLVVPLVNQGELVGMLNLGPRLSDTDYSAQDFRLLEKLTGHAAAAVRVALLVREHDVDLRERERIESEMRVARLIQQQLLPKNLPEVEGWIVHVHYRPAREVGGDFYDFIDLPDGRLALLAGDVTGKGVPAALVMATTRSLLRGEASRLLSPAEILRCANEQLHCDIPQNMFVTCLCAIIDPATGQMVMANAGHNLPYLRNGERVREFRATGMPLGLMAGVTYEESETSLYPGDSFLLHSDGLAEARDDSGEMYGFPRMKSVLEGDAHHERVIGRLLDSLSDFTGPEWEQDDDITLVVLHRMGGLGRIAGRPSGSFTALVEPSSGELSEARKTAQNS